MSYDLKPVKCRKDHTCCFCRKPIRAGERAMVAQYRQARCDEDDRQIGIEYVKFYLHLEDDEECTLDGCRLITKNDLL